MKQKLLYSLPMLGAALCLTACGRNNDEAQYDRAVTDVPRNSTVMTDRPNHPNRSGNLVSDVVDDGKEIVSDVVDGGRDIIDDAADAVDDAVGNNPNMTDENDNYRAGSDGRTDTH